MRRALVPVLALLMTVGVAGTLTGCGGTNEVAGLIWSGSVCEALTPWRNEINGLNAQAAQQMRSATTPSQTRDNLLRLLAGARTATEQARARVAAAGVPDVEGGAAIADQFVASLAGVRDAYGAAHDAIGELPLGSASAFYDSVSAAIGTLNKEYSLASLDTSKLDSAELRKDFDEAPACKTG
jgi:hypothetical protein